MQRGNLLESKAERARRGHSKHTEQQSTMRPDELRNFWNDFGSYGWTLPTVEFYGHSTGPHRCFSNFFEHAPFDFTVPESCGRAELIAAGRPATAWRAMSAAA